MEHIVSIFNAELGDDKSTPKSQMVFVSIMAPHMLQTVPELEATIDSFMAGTSSAHCLLVRFIDAVIRCKNAHITPIATISNNLLPDSKHLFDLESKNLQVRPTASFEGASEGDNPAGLNAHPDLVPQARSFELVRVPALVKRSEFQDFKVCAIDGDEAPLTVVKVKAILPFDLRYEVDKAA